MSEQAWTIEDYKRWPELSHEERAQLTMSTWDSPDERFNYDRRKAVVRYFKDHPTDVPEYVDFMKGRLADEIRSNQPGLISQIQYDIGVEMKEGPQVRQEQIPDSGVARFIAKNFADNPEAAIGYLMQEMPDIEWGFKDRQIVGKLPGERDYRVLDPDTGIFSSDFLSDVADVGYDTLAGVGTAAATAATTLKGAPMAAPAVAFGTTAAADQLKQGIGQYLGMQQEYDPMRSVYMGMFSAAPLVGREIGALASGPMSKLAGEAVYRSTAPVLGSKLAPKAGEGTKGLVQKLLGRPSKATQSLSPEPIIAAHQREMMRRKFPWADLARGSIHAGYQSAVPNVYSTVRENMGGGGMYSLMD